jgi:hypothetical protein
MICTHLLMELDREHDRTRNFWATELKNGKDAYAFLMKAIGSGALNATQTMNALHALFRIRDHGSHSDVLQKFIDTAGHSNQEIRSEAVQLAIGLIRVSRLPEILNYEPLALSLSQTKALRKAMAQGLTPKAAKLASEFLGS